MGSVVGRCGSGSAGRIAHRFARSEVRERARRYRRPARAVERSGWHLAGAVGEVGPRGVQRLLSAATWDADAVRDDLRAYVVDHLGDAASWVLIIDDTGPSAAASRRGRAPGTAPSTIRPMRRLGCSWRMPRSRARPSSIAPCTPDGIRACARRCEAVRSPPSSPRPAAVGGAFAAGAPSLGDRPNRRYGHSQACSAGWRNWSGLCPKVPAPMPRYSHRSWWRSCCAPPDYAWQR